MSRHTILLGAIIVTLSGPAAADPSPPASPARAGLTAEKRTQGVESEGTTPRQGPKARVQIKKAQPAKKEQPANKAQPAKEEQAGKASQVGQAPPAKVQDEATKGRSSPSFVDRDGDGIHDGYEHRFRRSRDRHGDKEDDGGQLKRQERRRVGSGGGGQPRSGMR